MSDANTILKNTAGILTARFMRSGFTSFVPSKKIQSAGVVIASAFVLASAIHLVNSSNNSIPSVRMLSRSEQAEMLKREQISDYIVKINQKKVGQCSVIELDSIAEARRKLLNNTFAFSVDISNLYPQISNLEEGLPESGSLNSKKQFEFSDQNEHDPISYTFDPDETKPEVIQKVLNVASKKNVDPAFVLSLFWLESRWGSDMHATTSSAGGPFQFLKESWYEAVMRYGDKNGIPGLASAVKEDKKTGHLSVKQEAIPKLLKARLDTELSAAIAIDMMMEQKADLEQSIGREVGLADMYISYLLGKSGAKKFLLALSSSPGVSSASIVRSATASNPRIFRSEDKKHILSVADAYSRVQDLVLAAHLRYSTMLADGPQRMIEAMKDARLMQEIAKQQKTAHSAKPEIIATGYHR